MRSVLRLPSSHTLILASLAQTGYLFAGTDYFIVEKVDRLRVYNKYQQEATPSDRQMFVPFVPMKIIKADDVLGDGFLRCMQVEVEGQIFFLIKDKDGNLTRYGPLGFEKTFRNAITLLDTIRTIHSIQISPVSSSAHRLSPGEKAIRVFRFRNALYCRTLGEPPIYGWLDPDKSREGRDWKVMKAPAPGEAVITPDIVEKIRSRVDETNRVLSRLFEYFNTRTMQQKQIPHWEVEASRKAVTCMLTGAVGDESFQQSTRYLVNDIENIVLGTGFQVAHSPGKIEVRQK